MMDNLQVFNNAVALYENLKFDVERAISKHAVVVWDKTQKKTYTTNSPLQNDVILLDCRVDGNDVYGVYKVRNCDNSVINTVVCLIEEFDSGGLSEVLNK